MKDIAAPPKFFRPAVENNFSQKRTAIFEIQIFNQWGVELNNGIGSTFDMKSEIFLLTNVTKWIIRKKKE
jgi:hypothetical protein